MMENTYSKGSPIWPERDDINILGIVQSVGENITFKKLWDESISLRIFTATNFSITQPKVGDVTVFYRIPGDPSWACIPYAKSLVTVEIISGGQAQEIVYKENGTWEVIGNIKEYNILSQNNFHGEGIEVGRRCFALVDSSSYTLLFNGFGERVEEKKKVWGRGNEIYEGTFELDTQGKIVNFELLYANQESDFVFSGYDYNSATGVPSDQLTPLLGGTDSATGKCFYEAYTFGNGTGSAPNSYHPFVMDFNEGCSVKYYKIQNYNPGSAIEYTYDDLYFENTPIDELVYWGNNNSGGTGGTYGTYIKLSRCGTGSVNPKLYGTIHPYNVSESVYGVPEQTRGLIEAENDASTDSDYLEEFSYSLAHLPGMTYDGQRLGVLLQDDLSTDDPLKSGKLNYLVWDLTKTVFGFDPPTPPQFKPTTNYTIGPARTRTGLHRPGMDKVEAYPQWKLETSRLYRTYNPVTDTPLTGANWCAMDLGIAGSPSSYGAHKGINEEASNFWFAGYAQKSPSATKGLIPGSNGVYASSYTVATIKVGSRYPNGGRVYASRTATGWFRWDTFTSSWVAIGTGSFNQNWYIVDIYLDISRVSTNFQGGAIVLT